jgi:hypothetical protein
VADTTKMRHIWKQLVIMGKDICDNSYCDNSYCHNSYCHNRTTTTSMGGYGCVVADTTKMRHIWKQLVIMGKDSCDNSYCHNSYCHNIYVWVVAT